MKILSGAYQKDKGRIRIDGKVVNITNPHAGRKLGIAIIYQEFALVPDLTVAENIYLDHLSTRRGFINWRALGAAVDHNPANYQSTLQMFRSFDSIFRSMRNDLGHSNKGMKELDFVRFFVKDLDRDLERMKIAVVDKE